MSFIDLWMELKLVPTLEPDGIAILSAAGRVEDCLRRALDGIDEDHETGLSTHAYTKAQIDQANRAIASLLIHFGEFVRIAASQAAGV